MFARFILSAFLGVSILFSAAELSAATDAIPRKTASVQGEITLKLLDHVHPSRDVARGQEQLEAQIIYASNCFTYAGPVCSLRVLLPVGAPCACYYPSGALRGVAQ